MFFWVPKYHKLIQSFIDLTYSSMNTYTVVGNGLKADTNLHTAGQYVNFPPFNVLEYILTL